MKYRALFFSDTHWIPLFRAEWRHRGKNPFRGVTTSRKKSVSLERHDGSIEIATCSSNGNNVLETIYFLGKDERVRKREKHDSRLWVVKFYSPSRVARDSRSWARRSSSSLKSSSLPSNARCRFTMDGRKTNVTHVRGASMIQIYDGINIQNGIF